MASSNDINSTEKLLNTIRGKDKQPFPPIGKTPLSSLPSRQPAKKISFSPSGLLADNKRYTVGVDISEEYIGLAKAVHALDGSMRLVDQRIVRYPAATLLQSREFKTLLQTQLKSFCGSVDDCSIWTTVMSHEVNVNQVKVPKVAAKQLADVIFWKTKKEYPFDENDVVFDFEIQDEIVDQAIPQHLVMVYTVPKLEVEKVKAFFRDMGVTLAGITIAPFAIQNIFRGKWLTADEETFASLSIGNNFSRIDIYHRENLVMTRGVKTGINSMVEEVADAMAEKSGRTRKVTADEARKVLRSLFDRDAGKLKETDTGSDLKEEEKFEMIVPVLERLSNQIERTFKHFASTVGPRRIAKLYVSLGMNVYDPILNYVSEQIGTPAEYFDPFNQQFAKEATIALKLDEKMALIPSLGLALSDKLRTPNAIFNYQEKARERTVRKINAGILAAFAAALILCVGYVISQYMEFRNHNTNIRALNSQLAQTDERLSTEQIALLKNQVAAQKPVLQQYAQRHLGMATIGEISTLTPESIRLTSLRIHTGGTIAIALEQPKESSGKETAAKESHVNVILEGIASGDSKSLDAFLDQYVKQLESSPMLRQVVVQKKKVMTLKKGDSLYFTVGANIG